MAFLEVKNLKKYYSKAKALDGVSFALDKGNILAIIGPSGNGKTTLLRCLNFLEIADQGSIVLNNVKIFDTKKKSLCKKELIELRDKFGLVFQSFNLFPQYTVFENVKLALEIVEKRRKKQNKPSLIEKESINAEVFEILNKLKLNEKVNSYPFELSGGEKQRVAIARALILKPSVLCFDEPTSALDPNLTKDVIKLIKELKNKFKLTIIIVTHEMKFAKSVSDEVMIMEKGKVVEFGKTEQVFLNPKSKIAKDFLNIAND